MSADLSKAYELLGVKPGVSIRELKAAHRDLAKVWHPDRFLHDPRLQEKAQEKLKEINEAYEHLSSGKIPRPVLRRRGAREPSASQSRTIRASRATGSGLQSLLLFAAVFAVTTRTLDATAQPAFAGRDCPAEQPSEPVEEPEQPARPDANSVQNQRQHKKSVRKTLRLKLVARRTPTPAPAVATVTVTIDPESGLLAKPDCRLRSRMTYPSGSQPTGYCNLSHAPPPKESAPQIVSPSFEVH